MARRNLDIPVGRLRLTGVSASPRRQEGLWVPSRRSFSDFEALWGPVPARRARNVTNEIRDEMVSEGMLPSDVYARLRCPRLEILPREKGAVLWEVSHQPFLPSRANPNQIYAEDYAKECRRLSQGNAGQRARDLLFSFLDDDQRKDAEVNGFFDVTLLSPSHWQQLDYLEHHHIRSLVTNLSAIRYRIERYRPTVWEMRPGKENGWYYAYAVCIHPTRPHPLDDIALGQLIELLRHPDDFVSIGNYMLDGVSFRTGPGTTMWGTTILGGDPSKLELPYLSPRTQAILGLDRIGRRMQETLDAMEYLR